MPHIHVRDAIRVVLIDMERFYTKSPYGSLLIGFERARTLSPNQLKLLRKREFGILPNTESQAIAFLRQAFVDFAATRRMLDEEDISEFSSSSDSSSDSSSSDSSTDSDKTVAVSPKQFVAFIDKNNNSKVKSADSQEI